MPHFGSPKHIFISLLLMLAKAQPIVAQVCYFPDGSEAFGYTLCNSTASVSHCCHGEEACLTNSLCYFAADQSINVGTCTDRSWQDSNCFQSCPTTPPFQNPSTNTLYRCDYDYWCCSAGGNITSCCNDPDVGLFGRQSLNWPALIFNGSSALIPGFVIVPNRTLSTNLNGPTSSATACSNSTDTIITDTTSTGTTRVTTVPSCSPISTSGTIGVGLGIGIVVIALSSVTSLLFLEKRKHRKLRQVIKNSHQAASNKQVNSPILLPNNVVERQMLPSNTIAEMQVKPQYHEIGSGQRGE